MRKRCNLLTYRLMWEGVFRSCGLHGDAAPKQAGAHEASGLDDHENAQALVVHPLTHARPVRFARFRLVSWCGAAYEVGWRSPSSIGTFVAAHGLAYPQTVLQEPGHKEGRAHECARKEARRASRATRAHPVLASRPPPRPGGWMETVQGSAFLSQ